MSKRFTFRRVLLISTVLATASYIGYWQTSTRYLLISLVTGHVSTCITYSNDGRMLVTGLASGEIGVWDVQNAYQSFSFRAHNGSLKVIKISPCGRLVASGDWLGECVVFDLSLRVPLLRHHGQELPIGDIAFSADSKRIAIATDAEVEIISLDNPAAKLDIQIKNPIVALNFLNDTELLACCKNAEISVIDISRRTSTIISRVPLQSINLASIAYDNKVFVVCDEETVLIYDNIITDMKRLPVARTIKLPRKAVKAIAISHSANRLAVSLGDSASPWPIGNVGEVMVFDSFSPEKQRTYQWFWGLIGALCFAPDESHLATGCHEGRVKIWDCNFR